MNKKCIVALIALGFIACKKENLVTTVDNSAKQSDVIYSDSAKVTIDQTKPGYKILPTFEGLSFETAILTENRDYLNPDNKIFIELLKNLGPGILRVGAGSCDKIRWTGIARNGETADSSLTTSDIDRLSAFSKAIGWPVLFGLNLGNNQVAACRNEATYAYNSLGSNLYAFQFGNEPNFFAGNKLRASGYTVSNYITEWSTYYTNVEPLTPQASFAGPDINLNSSWTAPFIAAEGDKVKLIGGHYYVTGPASNESITYRSILTGAGVLTSYLKQMNSDSSGYNVPFRVTECNSVWGGGKAGVSDVFASALWALDFMWTVAEGNGQGVNFHDGDGLFYSPLTMFAGTVTVHPEYYGMLAFKYGNNGGAIVPANISTAKYNCNAYACVNTDNSYSITIINREEVKNISFNIQLSKAASTIQIARLTAPSITATTNVTFAGNSVNADGSFTPKTTEKTTINNNHFNVNIPASSAAVITIR